MLIYIHLSSSAWSRLQSIDSIFSYAQHIRDRGASGGDRHDGADGGGGGNGDGDSTAEGRGGGGRDGRGGEGGTGARNLEESSGSGAPEEILTK